MCSFNQSARVVFSMGIAHSLLIRAAKISSSAAPLHSVFRLPMISASISSGELTGRSASSRLGGETNCRPGMGRGDRETKKGCVRMSGICSCQEGPDSDGLAYSDTLLRILLEHPLQQVSGRIFDLAGHLEHSDLDLLEEGSDIVVVER